MWGATYEYLRLYLVPEVSIHAPHVGCDRSKLISSGTTERFQFTHPMWGATDAL